MLRHRSSPPEAQHHPAVLGLNGRHRPLRARQQQHRPRSQLRESGLPRHQPLSPASQTSDASLTGLDSRVALADPGPQHHRLQLTRAHLRPAPPGRTPRPLHPARLQPAGRHTAAGDADHRVGQGPDPARRPPVARPWSTSRSANPRSPPTPGATTLLFPVADEALDAADPTALAAAARDLPLAYVGNQYDRDDAFAQFLAPAAAAHLPHLVAGKWTSTGDWPHVHFTGRIPFGQVEATYRRTLATVLLLPARYAAAGQMTQRLFEAVLAGCLPLTPTTIRHADRVHPTRPARPRRRRGDRQDPGPAGRRRDRPARRPDRRQPAPPGPVPDLPTAAGPRPDPRPHQATGRPAGGPDEPPPPATRQSPVAGRR